MSELSANAWRHRGQRIDTGLGPDQRRNDWLKMPRALKALDRTIQKPEQGEITAIEAIDSLLSEE